MIAFAALTVAGCGDEAESPADSSATAATASTGAEQGATEEEGSTESDQSETQTDDEATSPDGDDGGGAEGGAGDEEPARAPIKIVVEDGRFGAGTSDEVHVPTHMAVELDVTVKGSDDAKLLIIRPDGKKLYRTFPGGKRTTYLMSGLRPGGTMVVRHGVGQVVVIADLVPGP